MLRVLANFGADMHDRNNKNDSLLHMAARMDRADLCGFLLDKGVSTNEKNRDGMLPKDLAEKKMVKDMLHENA